MNSGSACVPPSRYPRPQSSLAAFRDLSPSPEPVLPWGLSSPEFCFGPGLSPPSEFCLHPWIPAPPLTVLQPSPSGLSPHPDPGSSWVLLSPPPPRIGPQMHLRLNFHDAASEEVRGADGAAGGRREAGKPPTTVSSGLQEGLAGSLVLTVLSVLDKLPDPREKTESELLGPGRSGEAIQTRHPVAASPGLGAEAEAGARGQV